MSDISYEIDNDGVAVVTWNLKDRSMNVLNFNSLGEYGEVIKKLILDENVKGIVLASAKEAFIAGADLTSSEVFGFDQKEADKTKAAEKNLQWHYGDAKFI
jgi:3-hydroxyacyl-CoA dehydrogenase/enoyl-CoA hydratase/3-hydroxybutyryl-CoA epimerase